MSAIDDIAAERQRQVDREGWSAEHDDRHFKGQLAEAAGVYAIASSGRFAGVQRRYWPWSFDWWKPSDARRNLVKAGALIVAEIERLDRQAIRAQPASPSQEADRG